MAKVSRETVDESTGELVQVNRITLDSLLTKDLQKKALKAAEMKDSDFEEKTESFWKPQDPTRKEPKELKGTYLGWTQSGTIRSHKVLTIHPKLKGQTIVMHVNGTEQLNEQLANAPGGFREGEADSDRLNKDGSPKIIKAAMALESPEVFIKFSGSTKTQEGNNLFLFDVRWPKS